MEIKIHPSQMLYKLLKDRNLKYIDLQKANVLTISQISAIIRGSYRISPPIAIKLSKYFGNNALDWLYAQARYDLEHILKLEDIDHE